MIAGFEFAYDIKPANRTTEIEQYAEEIFSDAMFAARQILEVRLPRGVYVYLKRPGRIDFEEIATVSKP